MILLIIYALIENVCASLVALEATLPSAYLNKYVSCFLCFSVVDASRAVQNTWSKLVMNVDSMACEQICTEWLCG